MNSKELLKMLSTRASHLSTRKFEQEQQQITLDSVTKKIRQVTKGDIKFKQYSVKFTKKARPPPVGARCVHGCHQVYLMSMRKLRVKPEGKTYRYIVFLMDIFSRFHRLALLESKSSQEAKKRLEEIYYVHGVPKCTQSDNGGKF